MKKIVLTLTILIGIGLSSCDIRTHNSSSCTTRLDVQLMDGGAMWVYGGKVHDGYISGNNEEGMDVWIPMHQVYSVIEVSCD